MKRRNFLRILASGAALIALPFSIFKSKAPWAPAATAASIAAYGPAAGEAVAVYLAEIARRVHEIKKRERDFIAARAGAKS